MSILSLRRGRCAFLSHDIRLLCHTNSACVSYCSYCSGFIDCMCSAGECVFVCVSAVSVEWMVEIAVVRCMW